MIPMGDDDRSSQLPPGAQGTASLLPDPISTGAPLGASDQPSEDREHINLLVVLHYVMAGLTALGACVPIVHLALGLTMVSEVFPVANDNSKFSTTLGWFFVIIASVAIVFGMALAICILLAGRNLQKRTGHTFCFVVACIMCLIFPVGTALGVFSIMVLNRPTVKALFSKDVQVDVSTSAASEFDRSVG